MKRNVIYSKEMLDEIMKSAAKRFEEYNKLSTDLPNNNESIDVSTSYIDNNNDTTLALLNQPNRESRRKEMKRYNSNSHELNISRINPMYTKDKDFCQKQKKKQFNEFIKGKVK